MKILFVVTAVFAMAIGCGGSKKPVSEPTPDIESTDDGASSEEEQGPVLIPPEKLDAIEAVFVRKRVVISRCFPAAIEAGELRPEDKGYVTVGLTVTSEGAPQNVRVVEATLDSQLLKSCVVEEVASWDFTTLPKPLDYSHTYAFERL